MRTRRLMAGAGLALLGVLLTAYPAARQAAPRFTDRQFWQLTDVLSEPDGFFPSDNLVSNELVFHAIVPRLRAVAPGGVYLGVGPEQNFTYIAATRPDLAVIVDIRRGNLQLHLLYKALFERSPTRRAFVAALFGREPLPAVGSEATADDLMFAVRLAPKLSPAIFETRVAAVLHYLERSRGFELRPGDRDGIRYIWQTFHQFGPDIAWSMTGRGAPPAPGRPGSPRSFARLVTQVDDEGRELSFLADEASYAIVRDLQLRNRVVPIVGDFAGPSALRAVGTWLRESGRSLSTFYVSNVEAYLRPAGTWTAFCRNVRSMPIDPDGLLVRPTARGGAVPRSSSQPPRPTINITRVEPIRPGEWQPQWRPLPMGARASGVSPLADEFSACEPPGSGVH